jgi:hypothetical protein
MSEKCNSTNKESYPPHTDSGEKSPKQEQRIRCRKIGPLGINQYIYST